MDPNSPSESSTKLTSTTPRSIGWRILVNTGSLAGSSLWRIFISFLLQILITRVLGVAEFGQYISALAFLNVSQVVSELGLPALLVRELARQPDRRRQTFFLSARVQILSSLATWAGLVLLAWLLPVSPMTRSALILVGASLPFYAVTSASQTLFKASERMELVMGVEGIINTLILGLSLWILWRGGGVRPLIGVLVLTQALSAILSIGLLWRTELLGGAQAQATMGWRQLWRAARPFYWLSLADVLLHRLDILLLNILAGDFVTGVYSIAYSVVRVLIKLIQSYWQALYPTLSRLHQDTIEQYRRLSSLSLRYGLMLVLPATAIGFGISSDLLQLLYGERSTDSVSVFQILIWGAPIYLFEMYAVTQLMATGHPRASLQITWVHIVGLLLLLPALTLWFGALGAASALITAGLVGAIWGWILLRRFSVPWHVHRVMPLLAATVVSALLATLLPLPWIARAMVSASLYLAMIWLAGVVEADDRRLATSLFR